MMAINIMIITTMTTILINTTTIILCKVFGFFRDKNGETGWLQGKGASWNLLVFPGEGNVQKPKSRKNLKSIHFCQIKPFWKDLCFLFKLSMQKLAQCELNICTPTLGIFLVYTLGTPPLHNYDLISIKIICYFYNFPTLCIHHDTSIDSAVQCGLSRGRNMILQKLGNMDVVSQKKLLQELIAIQ